jgi:hypothetical protein
MYDDSILTMNTYQSFNNVDDSILTMNTYQSFNNVDGSILTMNTSLFEHVFVLRDCPIEMKVIPIILYLEEDFY